MTSRPTVLVVEDDVDSREMLACVLELHGFRPVLAADGVDALDRLRAERPCVILLDLMMPRMNGWEFRETQLRDEANRSIPVVVLSAAGRAAESVPADAYLQKPINMDAVISAVRTHCRARG
jgi:CheY-like chemotaxis protein